MGRHCCHIWSLQPRSGLPPEKELNSVQRPFPELCMQGQERNIASGPVRAERKGCLPGTCRGETCVTGVQLTATQARGDLVLLSGRSKALGNQEITRGLLVGVVSIGLISGSPSQDKVGPVGLCPSLSLCPQSPHLFPRPLHSAVTAPQPRFLL